MFKMQMEDHQQVGSHVRDSVFGRVTRSHDVVELGLGALATGTALRGEGGAGDEDAVAALGLARGAAIGAALHGALVDESADENEEQDGADDDGDDSSSVSIIILIQMLVDSASKSSDLSWGKVRVEGDIGST